MVTIRNSAGEPRSFSLERPAIEDGAVMEIDDETFLAYDWGHGLWEVVGDAPKHPDDWDGPLPLAVHEERAAAAQEVAAAVELAQGGVVTGPPPVIVGEHGPEVVVPVDPFPLVADNDGSI